MCSPFLCEGSGQHPAPTWSWCPHSQFMDSMRLDPETVDSLDTYSHIPPQLMEKCAALSVRPDTVRRLVQSMQGAGVVKAVEGGNDVMVSSAVALSAPPVHKGWRVHFSVHLAQVPFPLPCPVSGARRVGLTQALD